jgi:hypothetical protein
MHITITVAVGWPSTLDGLTRWSKRLFAAFYTCGILGCLSLVGGIWLAVAGHGWPATGLFVLMLLLGAVMGALEPLMYDVDTRRYEATQAQQPQHTGPTDQA